MWPKDGNLTFSSIKGRSRSFFTHYLISRIIFFIFWNDAILLLTLQRCRTRTAYRNSDGVAFGRCRTDTCRISTCCVSESDFVAHSYWMMRCCNRRKCGLDSMFNVFFRQFCPFHKASSKMLFSCCYVFHKRRSFFNASSFFESEADETEAYILPQRLTFYQVL